MGEPAGIGGELTVRAWAWANQSKSDNSTGSEIDTSRPFFAIDDPTRLSDISNRLRINVPIFEIDGPEDVLSVFADGLPVLPLSLPAPAVPGNTNPENAAAVLKSIEMAVDFAKCGSAAAVVTNPIQKSALYAAGFKHPGHTEYLAELTGGTPVMMLACPGLVVCPLQSMSVWPMRFVH